MKEFENPDKYKDIAREPGGDSDTSCSWGTGNDPQRPEKIRGKLAIRGRLETI